MLSISCRRRVWWIRFDSTPALYRSFSRIFGYNCTLHCVALHCNAFALVHSASQFLAPSFAAKSGYSLVSNFQILNKIYSTITRLIMSAFQCALYWGRHNESNVTHCVFCAWIYCHIEASMLCSRCIQFDVCVCVFVSVLYCAWWHRIHAKLPHIPQMLLQYLIETTRKRNNLNMRVFSNIDCRTI